MSDSDQTIPTPSSHSDDMREFNKQYDEARQILGAPSVPDVADLPLDRVLSLLSKAETDNAILKTGVRMELLPTVLRLALRDKQAIQFMAMNEEAKPAKSNFDWTQWTASKPVFVFDGKKLTNEMKAQDTLERPATLSSEEEDHEKKAQNTFKRRATSSSEEEDRERDLPAKSKPDQAASSSDLSPSKVVRAVPQRRAVFPKADEYSPKKKSSKAKPEPSI